MRKILLSLIVLTLLSSTLFAAENKKHSYKPPQGYVPDEVSALKIAEAVLIPIYGETTIAQERPLTAKLEKEAWLVQGTLHCPDGERCKGGVAKIEISKDDGKILRVSHGE